MKTSVRRLLGLVAVAGCCSYLATVGTRPEGDPFLAAFVGGLAVAVLVGSTVFLLLGALGVIGRRK